ncbi:MAG: hypothetical protein JXA19_06355 [Anaerolineales bacterium]|nr:hypothetical protein [Anaerolineales bacterium]
MRKSHLFWASILIIAGIILLMNNLGIINVSWNVIWPAFLILLGVWIVVGRAFGKDEIQKDELSIPREAIQEGKVSISHGAGCLRITGNSSSDEFLSGEFTGGVLDTIESYSGRKQVSLKVPSFDWIYSGNWGPKGLDWLVNLNPEVIYELVIEGGASENHINLENLQISKFKVSTGASSTILNLPAHGMVDGKVESGAASVEISIPEKVEGRIEVEAGLASVNVSSRFRKQGNQYISDGYGQNPDQITLKIETGVGSVNIN